MDEAVEKKDYITFEIEKELKVSFQAKCKENDMTISQQMRKMIKSFLGENE